jgi:hypothetical protein
MATLFNLWHARDEGEEDAVSFDVTRTNVPSIDSADRHWIEEALRALGIAAEARKWEVTSSRSHYFSDYRSPDEDWMDRWPLFWVVRVSVAGHIRHEPLSLRPVPFGVLDSTSTGEPDTRHEEHATIIAVGPPGQVPEEIPELGGSSTLREVDGARSQLRLEVRAELPAEIERLEAAVAALERAGWATEWRAAT